MPSFCIYLCVASRLTRGLIARYHLLKLIIMMKLVHISQFRETCPWLEDPSIPSLSGHPEDIIRRIQSEYSSSQLFIIDLDDNQEERVPDFGLDTAIPDEEPAEPSHWPGARIRVLKLLRLKAYMQHCIVYSRRTREELLLEDPRNTILGSPGVTFVTLTDEPPTLDYERLHRQIAPRDLSAYFVAEGGRGERGHSLANSWGVWKLWEVQRAVDQITSQRTEEIERSFGKAYEQMNTYEGLLARYLKGNPYEDINKSLNEKMLLWGELLEQEQSVQAQYEAEMKAIDTLRQSLTHWSAREVSPSEFEAARVVIKTLEGSVDRAKAILAKCQAIKLERNSISARKYTMNMRLSRELNRLSDNTFAGMRKRLLASPPKIVFVDEHALDGWSQILQRIIYGREHSDHFHAIVPTEGQDYKELASLIEERVIEMDADLLILDLRLQGEYGLASALENAAGMQVLSELSERLACPILIASTTEKMINYRELLSWGATASWTKQGLDDRNDVEYTVSNYVSLVQTIHTLCFNESIRFCYKEFLPMIQDLEMAKPHELWWESSYVWHTMVGYRHLRPERTKLLQLLNTAYGHMRELIGSTVISGAAEELSESDNSLIVTGIFQAMEYLYNVDSIERGEEEFVHLVQRIKGLTPEVSVQKLYRTIIEPRNTAIHEGRISRVRLEQFVRHFFDFLEGRGFMTQEAKADDTYISVVSYIKENGYGNQSLIFLKNDKVKLEGGRDSITLIESEINKAGYSIVDIEPGTRVRHQLTIERNAKGAISYYARNISLEE